MYTVLNDKRGWLVLAVLVTALGLASLAMAANKGYYREQPQFHFYPEEGLVRYGIQRLGPLGFGVELRQPAFTMVISTIEPGSPAEGKLKAGQILESINGDVLKDIDPRVQLGNLITQIESTDGVARLMVKDTADGEAYPVEIRIPVLGAYSETWPMDCGKSDRIVRDFADFLGRVDKPGWGAALFLLSTGEEKDLDVVRRWFHGMDPKGAGHPWSIGYTGPAICEYYLRTGDETVLGAIKSRADYLTRTIYNGSWMGRGGANYGYMSGGHMNAAGVHALTFLLLAKQCGVDLDEHTLQSSLYHFYRYAGHDNVSYGDGLPEGGFTDNGKVGGLAFAMAAAASLTPDGENSVYAKARDISATKSFYSTSWLFHGHTGGGIGEIWRGAAMGLMHEKRPLPFRTFMDERRWLYELSRMHDGAFGISGGPTVGGRYEQTGHNGGLSFGNYFPLVYTVPRKQLRIFGAPPSTFSKPYALPARPWGTEADEAFISLTPAEYAPGKVQDISKEQLRTDASMQIFFRMNAPNVPDETLVMYAHHIDQGIRHAAAGAIVKHHRVHLILPLLDSGDPRVRHAGLLTLNGGSKNPALADEHLTDAMLARAAAMVEDPEEALWVVEAALTALGRAQPSVLSNHVDRIAYWLDHEDWWLRHAALLALPKIASDKRYYKQILPLVGKTIATNQRAVALQPVGRIVRDLQASDPEVKAFAMDVLAQAYLDFPRKIVAPGGQNLSSGVDFLTEGIARNLTELPSGFDVLFRAARKRFPDQTLPHQDLIMDADASEFGPELREALKPIILTRLMPEFIARPKHIGSNRKLLLEEVSNEVPFNGNGYYTRPRVEDLVEFYNRIGIHDYDWHDFGPAKSEIAWDYFSFDPPEQTLWSSGTRYRKVTLPEGMENWCKPEFDVRAAKWKTGFGPFAHHDGRLEVGAEDCSFVYCQCNEAPKTLWENEVLLLRGKVKLPLFRDGYRYRLVVGGFSHNFAGDGISLFVNGKKMIEETQGTGKRGWGRMVGYYLDKSWWDDFGSEPVIAATSFLSIPGGRRSPGVKKGYLSIWIQEMKVPPFGEEQILQSLKAVPLNPTKGLGASEMPAEAVSLNEDEVDAEQMASATNEDPDRGKYRWDGEFAANASILGEWVQIGGMDDIADYKPGGRYRGDAEMPDKLVFVEKGRTTNPLYYYSGHVLLDLEKNYARKMGIMESDAERILVIERMGGSGKTIPVVVYRKNGVK